MSLRRTVLILLALVLLAAACGDGAGGGDTGASPPGEGITIAHAHGETTVDGHPERIVTLGLQWTDVVLSLRVEPVGHDLDPLAGDDGLFPWHADRLAGSTGLDVTDGLPFEQIAALDPDLILVAPYLVEDDASFESLAAIAPTIAGLDDSQVDP